MTVKRYTPTQCCEHDGTYVTYCDYQKLAVENARLIALAKGWAIAVDNCYFNETGDIYTDSIDTCNKELSTIAVVTNAEILELRAQGVEQLANELYGSGYVYDTLKGYAANLRAERKV
jgi:hypothetical protein